MGRIARPQLQVCNNVLSALQSAAARSAIWDPTTLNSMQLKIQPRLQLETWSLYWKASTRTQTKCLDAFTLDLNGVTSCTVARMMDQVAAHCNWPPEDGLTRLEGFTDSWQRALHRGRLLEPSSTLEAVGIAEGDVVTVVRIQLEAEGWKIQDEFSMSESDDDS